MEKMKFNVDERDEYTIVHFELDGPIVPEVLSSIDPPKVDSKKGVVLSGRGPIWLYGFLIHYYHPTKFVATYDPRLRGAVVIESHSPEHRIGDIITLDL